MTVGIICEYNPLHLGHYKQLQQIREEFGPECGIVCLMSGNFVQRGMPAIIDKSLRARAAVECGADLVLELPVNYALSSAEGFAAGGVAILSKLCDVLCFGSETGTKDSLMSTAASLLGDSFSLYLKEALATGCSFPAARQQALARLGNDDSLLSQPNDILAIEYCKAILSQNSPLIPFPIPRAGGYHDLTPDPENPSATAIRRRMLAGESWQEFLPEAAARCFAGAPLHSIEAGERAMLAKLRTMTEEEFEALPFGSEGLWRKFMHACRQEATLEGILTATKSKRYTRTRIDRMAMCAFLGITQEMLEAPAPYCRVLAFNGRGRELLKAGKETLAFCNAGAPANHPYELLEQRCADLYGLFALAGPEAPGAERRRRIYYYNKEKPCND